jgi:Xaa-Pro aminopeptidase
MQIKSLKLPDEVEIYQDAFALSNNAIFNTINWLKEKVDQEEKISEKELNQQTTIFYQNEGSLSQSFKTISGASENGAIVHYSTPSATRVINRDDLILLDSGGYYDSGVATDTTRTFLSSHHCDEKKLKEYRYYYTLVLKSQINAESAVFKPGTSGKAIDYVARRPLYELGLDFNHGLGHGVGVLVHEDGIRLSSATDLPLKVGQIVSIEPGIYFDHKFGIRLENVVVVKPHETLKNLLCFKPLVWIPWEEKLIDRNLMSKNEIKYLDWYQEQSNQRLNIFK